jgi:energy-coupling factor transporter ATP-binding protein EcfA2
VTNSGWIEVSDVTALIGTNESGKTNLLLPLWKLNPAGKDGQIDLLSDAPRRRYNEMRAGEQDEVFIEAIFELDGTLPAELSALTGADLESLKRAIIKRRYDGKYVITLPDHNPSRTRPANVLCQTIREAIADVSGLTPLKSETDLKEEILRTLKQCESQLNARETVDSQLIEDINGRIAPFQSDTAAKTSVLVPRLGQLLGAISELQDQISRPRADSVQEARKLILARLPKFVYYSNYGNLDSEIYLPHVIDNMQRENLGSKESAKVRTLKVLFDFVRLSAAEVLELGREFRSNPPRTPSDEEVQAIARKKKERDVLLQSASTELTASFKEWWQQGEYRFRFQADGDHFRIWVSDDRRPEDIELEGRSTGLQWFLSFYLIFLVESEDAHAGAILLLDEPGLSLHPLAQRDLSNFFDNLADSNQILYTTHSPFLVDPNHLDRIKAVYIQEDGSTGVSSDLRAGEKQRAQSKSIYPVYAALGISVSDILMVGAEPIIVEGSSDQFYLSAMKNLMIGLGQLKPSREIVFIPAGGTKGVKAVAGILAGRDEKLPTVLLDADTNGKRTAQELKTSLYQTEPDRVVVLSSVSSTPNAEIEDLVPLVVMLPAVDKFLRGPDEDFSDRHQIGSPILPQVEQFAKDHGLSLTDGWKVDLARAVKTRILKLDSSSVDHSLFDSWKKLFGLLSPMR